MSFVSDKFHGDKLKSYGINIKVKYIVNNKILERNSDNSFNDDIQNGIRCRKDYYVDGVLKKVEKEFDSRIEYTFISKDQENQEYICPNCGIKSLIKNVTDGCPYCKTYYNIDYTDKDLGGKYHYDQVIHNNIYRFITGVIDLIFSIIISYIFIKSTSRTFNNIDIAKVFIYGFILSLVLYYLFYSLDAYIIIAPIKKYKEKQNNKQRNFWKQTNIDKKSFFNNFNYEIRKYYYNMEDVVDYDILDYLDFNEYNYGDKTYVDVKVCIRLVFFRNKNLFSKKMIKQYTVCQNKDKTTKLMNGVNIIMCPNCGSSIDINKSECSFCHTKINYLQEWFLVSKNNVFTKNN